MPKHQWREPIIKAEMSPIPLSSLAHSHYLCRSITSPHQPGAFLVQRVVEWKTGSVVSTTLQHTPITTSLSDVTQPPCVPHLHTKTKPHSHIFVILTPHSAALCFQPLAAHYIVFWYVYTWVQMALSGPTYCSWQPLLARNLTQADFMPLSGE